MRFIDGVQPPLTLWGELFVRGGKFYFQDHEGSRKVGFNPTAYTVRLYRDRVSQ